MANRITTFFSRLRHTFTEHPRSLGESYLHHLWCALSYGAQMIIAGLAVIIHAFLPFLFKTTGSSLAKSICDDVDKRNR